MIANLAKWIALTAIVCNTAIAESKASPSAALVRSAIVTNDVEASKTFYSYALGYTVSFDGDITSDEVRALLQLSDEQTARFVVLKGAESIKGEEKSSAMIGLLFIEGAHLGELQRPSKSTLAVGETMLAILTDDIAAVNARLEELQARIVYAPTKSVKGPQTELVVYDPNGVRIHVVEMSQ